MFLFGFVFFKVIKRSFFYYL
uniref:Uncharacterized protein n=1 Tax=Anguilla anguilla TaxID=7936 RepID=A0A0E9S2A9_ANGAN